MRLVFPKETRLAKTIVAFLNFNTFPHTIGFSMNDNHFNRLSMFQTCLRTLHEYREVWFDQAPQVFTKKVEHVKEAVTQLEALGRKQEADTTGNAEDKRREAAELEEAAYIFGSTLAIWFEDHDDATRGAQVELSQSGWRRLRRQQLLEKARLVHELGESVFQEHPESAAEYGITEEELAAFLAEIDDYASVVSAPQQSIAQRKALTTELSNQFSDVTRQFELLDKLILQFGRRSGTGRDLVAAYQASRVIRDLGSRRSTAKTSEPEVAT